MEAFNLTPKNLQHHALRVTYAFDPPIVFENERTRLSMFAEAACQRYPRLFPGTHLGPDGLSLSCTLLRQPFPFQTLAAAGNELVLTLPLETKAGGHLLQLTSNHRQVLDDTRRLFFGHIVGRTLTRVEHSRHASFETGAASMRPLVTRRGDFDQAALGTAELTLHLRDDRHHVKMCLCPGAAALRIGWLALPAQHPSQPGLIASILTQSAKPAPLTEEDVTELFDRAEGLWPDAVVEYIAQGEAVSGASVCDAAISLDDLLGHLWQVTMHVLPPICVQHDRATLLAFAEEVYGRYPQHYTWTEIGPAGLDITSQQSPDEKDILSTVRVNGPQVIFGLPIEGRERGTGDWIRPMPDYRGILDEVRGAFFRHVAGRQTIRTNVLRHAMFELGRQSAIPLLTSRGNLGDLSLGGAQLSSSFQAAPLGIQLMMSAGVIAVPVPSGAGPLQKPLGQGLVVDLAVNPLQPHVMAEPEVTGLFDRADALWPNPLLKYINTRTD